MSKNYPFKVWLTTLLLAPIFYFILIFLLSVHAGTDIDKDIFLFIVYCFIFGVVFSIPTFVIYLIIYLNANIKSIKNFRILLISISIIGMVISIFLFFGKDSYNINENYSGLSFTILYSTSIILSSFIFSIQKK